MIRITPLQEDDAVARLLVEGQITQQTIEELTVLCDACLTHHSTLLLEVSGVKFIDAAGLDTLRSLKRKGTVLIGCSGFLTEMLQVNPVGERPASELAQPDERTSETRLLEGLRRGDTDACEILVRQYGGRMLATARRLLGNEHDALDAVQDAFLSAFQALDQFLSNAKLSTWLHRITVNAALMKLRSHRRRPEESLDDLLPRFNAEGEWLSGTAHWETPSEVLLERQETRVLVRRCIDRLPETYRTILLLRDIEELDTEEVANVLNITPNAVKIRLHRARQALRTLVERELSTRPARMGQDIHPTPSHDPSDLL